MYFLPLRMPCNCGLLPFNPAQPEASPSRNRHSNFCNLVLVEHVVDSFVSTWYLLMKS